METQLIVDNKPMGAIEGHTCERRVAPLCAGFNGFLTAHLPREAAGVLANLALALDGSRPSEGRDPDWGWSPRTRAEG